MSEEKKPDYEEIARLEREIWGYSPTMLEKPEHVSVEDATRRLEAAARKTGSPLPLIVPVRHPDDVRFVETAPLNYTQVSASAYSYSTTSVGSYGTALPPRGPRIVLP